jgi:hypothetical protein
MILDMLSEEERPGLADFQGIATGVVNGKGGVSSCSSLFNQIEYYLIISISIGVITKLKMC